MVKMGIVLILLIANLLDKDLIRVVLLITQANCLPLSNTLTQTGAQLTHTLNSNKLTINIDDF